jgi:hypothetical protein
MKIVITFYIDFPHANRTIQSPQLRFFMKNNYVIPTGYPVLFFYGSTALCWDLAAFSVSWSYTQLVGLFGLGIRRSQGLYLHTEQHKHRINTHNTNIHASSGILTHDPSVRASEESSCLRPRGYCDRLASERAKTVHALDRAATVTA